MLDFMTRPAHDEPQTKTTQVRHGEHLGMMIDRAARTLAVDKSTFVRSAIEREATRVLEAQSKHVLAPEDVARFAAALDTPPAPTPRALKAARLYSARVVHAD